MDTARRAGIPLGRRWALPSSAAAVCLASIGWSGAPAEAGEDSAFGTAVWDTRRALDEVELDIRARKGWQLVRTGAADHSFRGDVVLENDRIAVVFRRRSAGPLVYSKAAADRKPHGIRLVPVAPGGERAGSLGVVRIRKNTGDEATLEVSTRTRGGGRTRTAFTLSLGRVFVEIRPIERAARIRIEAATRFVVIPDFFGADMVFDPRAYPQPRLIVPSENFVLNLLEAENTIVMTVWPTGDQKAEVVLAGAKDDRRIRATEISFDGKSIYVAILRARGIWHEHRLGDSYVEKDIGLGWARPFQAKWRADFCAARRSDSWNFRDGKKKAWMYLYGPLLWPCWFDGEKGFVRLSKRFVRVKGSMEFVLAYPLERSKGTPLAVFTPVDIVRDTLGVGPCEYVLDREGIRHRSVSKGRRSFGRGVCDSTSPIEYFFIRGIESRESAVVGHLVDDILADNKAINARVQEFRRFGRELAELCAAFRRDSTVATPLLDEAEKSVKEIDALYQRKLETIKTPAHAAGLGRTIKELTREHDPENLGRCKTLTRELRDIGGTQHHMVSEYRVMVKRLRQEAAIHGTADSSAAKMAEEVRKLAGQVLRRKYGVEAD